LAPTIIGLERPEIIARALEVGKIVAGSVFDVSQPERFLIADFPNVDEEFEVWIVVLPEPADRPVAARSADYLEVAIRIARNAADDGRHLLPTLRLDALDQIFAALLVQQPIFAIMPGPHAPACWIDQFVGPGDHGTRSEFRNSVASPREDIVCDPATSRRGLTAEVGSGS